MIRGQNYEKKGSFYYLCVNFMKENDEKLSETAFRGMLDALSDGKSPGREGWRRWLTALDEGQDARKYFACGGGFFARYKKWSLDYCIDYQNQAYTAVSKTTFHTPSYSYIQLIYNFTPNFYISAAVQYMNNPQHTDVWTYSDTYRSFSTSRMQDLSWRPWILIRYTFRKNVKKKIKLENVIKGSRENGIRL